MKKTGVVDDGLTHPATLLAWRRPRLGDWAVRVVVVEELDVQELGRCCDLVYIKGSLLGEIPSYITALACFPSLCSYRSTTLVMLPRF